MEDYDMIKWISIILSALVIVVGAVFFLEDRYENKANAKTMKTELINNTINTFKSMQKDIDQSRLETLRNQKYLFEQELKKDPDNGLLRQRIEILDKEINALENKLYK
jgi:Tfp pilus assembly protein PilO